MDDIMYNEIKREVHDHFVNKRIRLENEVKQLKAKLEKHRWVPVKERQPKDEDKVDIIVKLIFTSGGEGTKRLTDFRWGDVKLFTPVIIPLYWGYINLPKGENYEEI